MDVQYPLLVVGTAERHIASFDLAKNPAAPQKVRNHLLNIIFCPILTLFVLTL